MYAEASATIQTGLAIANLAANGVTVFFELTTLAGAPTGLPPVDENAPASAAELIFPHFVDGGGYTTQFVLFSGSTGQASNGTLKFFGQGGAAFLSVAVAAGACPAAAVADEAHAKHASADRSPQSGQSVSNGRRPRAGAAPG